MNDVVAADVLDAWFPPAPSVVAALQSCLHAACRTSPPAHADHLRGVLARARGVPESRIVLGAGSSDLIFRAFQAWLTRDSRVVVTDPIYSEYTHVLTTLIGCDVVRVPARESAGFQVDPEDLRRALRRRCDLVVLVNPATPTGVGRDPSELLDICANHHTRVWIDEAYVDFDGACPSVEHRVRDDEQVVVCKTLSKAYALSGIRAAYLVAPTATAHQLATRAPPWNLSLPAQIAAAAAVTDQSGYYPARWAETALVRTKLVTALTAIAAAQVLSLGGPMVLVRVPREASGVIDRCRCRGVFLRDARPMFTRSLHPSIGEVIRVAVPRVGQLDRLVTTLDRAIR